MCKVKDLEHKKESSRQIARPSLWLLYFCEEKKIRKLPGVEGVESRKH